MSILFPSSVMAMVASKYGDSTYYAHLDSLDAGRGRDRCRMRRVRLMTRQALHVAGGIGIQWTTSTTLHSTALSPLRLHHQALHPAQHALSRLSGQRGKDASCPQTLPPEFQLGGATKALKPCQLLPHLSPRHLIVFPLPPTPPPAHPPKLQPQQLSSLTRGGLGGWVEGSGILAWWPRADQTLPRDEPGWGHHTGSGALDEYPEEIVW